MKPRTEKDKILTPRVRHIRGEPMFTPEDKCSCGHRRKEHSGIRGVYPGACSICEDISKCSQFKEHV